ncbi:hypothetical protein LEMLEM_LOCUS5355 [Lemmus lemmus]
MMLCSTRAWFYSRLLSRESQLVCLCLVTKVKVLSDAALPSGSLSHRILMLVLVVVKEEEQTEAGLMAM